MVPTSDTAKEDIFNKNVNFSQNFGFPNGQGIVLVNKKFRVRSLIRTSVLS